MNKYRNLIGELVSSRKNLLELILIAVLLALSIDIISSSIGELFSLSAKLMFSIGLFIFLIVIGYSVKQLLKNKHRSHIFEGFFVYSKKSNEVIPVPQYEYSEELHSYLMAAFTENSAFKTMWDKEPLNEIFKKTPEENRNSRSNKSIDLITEATEYFVLDKLSTHLTDYFNKDVPEKSLKNFERSDIPDVLLSNRLLELFSKPIEERAVFIDDDVEVKNKKNKNGTLAYSNGEARFSLFELTLPAGSKFKRGEKNQLEINTSRFILKIKIEFLGLNTFIPFEFHEYILNQKGKEIFENPDFEVKILIDIDFKSLAFLSTKGWDYYYWVDSFLEEISESFEKESFFERIGWNQVLTTISYMEPRISSLLSSKKVIQK